MPGDVSNINQMVVQVSDKDQFFILLNFSIKPSELIKALSIYKNINQTHNTTAANPELPATAAAQQDAKK